MGFRAMKGNFTRMMRYFFLAATVSTSLLIPCLLRADSNLTAPNASVGYHLETLVKINLGEGAPEDGLNITVRSADPKRLLISKTADQPGAASIVVQARQGFRESPEVWLQAMDSSGTVEYTAEAAGYTKSAGTITLTPSGVIILGPLKAKKLLVTTGGEPSRVVLHAVRLDSALKFVEDQPTAGGFPLSVNVTASNDSVGRVEDNPVVIPAGRSALTTFFKPAGEGETILSIKPPAGFKAATENMELTASVRKPGLALSDQLLIGENLQVSGVLNLGEFPGGNGVEVTLTSEDETKLLLSNTATEVGHKTITIKLALSETSARYYLQALGKSGTVSYTATAPGFRKRTAIIGLAPSGIVVTPIWQGPPDEAQVLRATAPESKSKFSVGLSETAMKLVVWTVRLDPITHRSADITVQPLRAGQTLTVPLTNSNPAVGEVATEVTIPGGSDHVITSFAAKQVGSTEIAVTTPKEYTPSANSTAVVGFVRK